MARRGARGAYDSRGSDLVPRLCLLVFGLVWVALAIAPRYREAWFLENLLTALIVPLVILTYRKHRISDGGYVLGTLFLVLHTIGSHYTYSEVPLGDVVRDWMGSDRNHYDRFVHLAFGLLMERPLRELTIRRPAALGTGATFLIGVALVALASVVYEVAEWWVAIVSDPDAGHAFLGTQGDIWDAQWDMALACAGGVIAATVHLLKSRGRQDRDATLRRRLIRVRLISVRR